MQDINQIRVTGTKHFETEDVRRIPVHVDEQAQALINVAPQQGRLFPLALSEIFGTHAGIKEIDVEAIKKSDLFPLAPTEKQDAMLLRITIKHVDPQLEDGVKLINADDINQIHPSGMWGFNAALTAYELLRLHKMERGI